MQKIKHRFLSKLARIIVHHPKKIVGISLLLTVISGIYAATNLKLDTDQDNLISKKLAYHQRYKNFLAEFGDWEYFFVVFEVPKGKDTEAKQTLLALKDQIEPRTDLYSEITFSEDLSVFKNSAFLLLPPAEFESLNDKLKRWAPDINRILGLQNYADLINYASDRLSGPTEALQKNEKDLESAFQVFSEIIDGITSPEKIRQLTPADLFAPVIGKKYHHDPDGFTFSPNGKLLFLKIMPHKDYSTTKVVEEPLNFLRSQMDLVRKQFPDIPFGVTGRPVLQADEMSSTGNDSLWASVASILGVAFLYILYLRTLKRPGLIIGSLICGMGWSIGFITLTLGHLNMLTIVFAIILVGLGVDYGMHFLLRYLKERRDGATPEMAVEKTMTATGGSIITGAITTAVAFLTALFSDFLGLKELGFVAGTGVIFCLTAEIVTLPACLLLWDRASVPARTLNITEFKGLDWSLKKPRTALAIVFFLTALSLPLAANLKFENNLLKLQDPNLESVRYEHKIIEDSGISTWFAAFVVDSKEKLKEIESQVARIKTVGGFESIFSVAPHDQEERIEKLQSLKKQFAIRAMGESRGGNDISEALTRLHSSLDRLQGLAFEGGKTEAVEEIDLLLSKVIGVQTKLKEDPESTLSQIRASQKAFFTFLDDSTQSFLANLQPQAIDETALPSSIQKRYQSDRGNYVLYVYPEKDIWEEEPMEEFIGDLRKIDATVTGSPIGVYESATRMKKGFYLVGALTTVFIFFFLLFDFRSLKESLIATLPLASGLLWLVAWMYFFGISLNLANFFALPILIGVGIDNGVHLVHRFREKPDIKDMLHTVAPAIILSTLTTLIGFGALSFVRHRGLASFGQIMALGSLTCLVASLLIVPLVLKIIHREQK